MTTRIKLYFHTIKILLLLSSSIAFTEKAVAQIDSTFSKGDLDTLTVFSGYQKIKPTQSTGSYVLIDSAILSRRTGLYILDRLENSIAGLNFNRKTGAPQIMIRGLSSINVSNEPLVVVDNFPYEGSIQDLNPEDVKSITVLKDASAMAIWGARAGNGVIVITTKSGTHAQRPIISVSSNIQMESKPNLMSLPTISSKDFITVERYLFDNGYYNSKIARNDYPALTPVVALLLANRNGEIATSLLEDSLSYYGQLDNRRSYLDVMYNNPILQQSHFDISLGGKSIQQFFSFGYDYNKGNVSNTFDRWTLRSKTTVDLSKKLKLSTNIFYQESTSTSGKPSYGSITYEDGSYIPPYITFSTDTKEPLYIGLRKSYLDTAGAGLLLDWKYYPTEDYRHSKNTERLKSIMVAGALDYSPIRSLQLQLQYQYQMQQSENKIYYDESSYYARNYINRFSQIDYNTGKITRAIPLGGILSQNNSEMQAQNYRGQASYDVHYDKWSISALAGMEIRQNTNTSSSNYVYGYDDRFLTFGAVDYQNTYATYVTGSRSSIPSGINFSNKLNRFLSYYGNASITYLEQFILSGSIRKDESNIFGVNANQKGVPLWSIGGKWRLSKFLSSKQLIFEELDIRSSLGVTGNIDLSRSAVTTVRYGSNASYTNYRYATVDQLANPNLQWEESKMWNIGVDFALKNRIISGSIEYYIKNGKNLIGPSPIDYTGTGTVLSLDKNVASMRGNGIDLTLNVIPVNHHLFKWDMDILFSMNKSYVKEYENSSITAMNVVGDGAYYSPMSGKPLYSLISYQWAGLNHDDGQPQGFINGTISTDYTDIVYNTPIDQLVYHGSAIPTFFGAITQNLAYKQFQLGITFAYNLGYYFRSPSINYNQLYSFNKGNQDFEKRWQQPGDELKTYVPAMTYPTNADRDQFYANSSVLVHKADNIRIKTINLIYTNKSWKIHANVTSNIILWHSSKIDYDPDYAMGITPPNSFSFGIVKSF